MVDGRYIELLTMVYKPTRNITGEVYHLAWIRLMRSIPSLWTLDLYNPIPLILNTP